MRFSRRGFGSSAAMWLGCLAATGALVLALVAHQSSAPGIRVWTAARDLPVGLVLTKADVEAVSISVPQRTAQLLLRTSPIRQRLTRVAPAGALLTGADFARAPATALRLVTLTVESGRAPAALSRGAIVDVWATPTATWDAASSGGSRRVASAVVVAAVSRADPTGALAIKIQIDSARVSSLIAATHAGGIDIVEVPDAAAGGS
ncbi:MAG: hypothetical protein KGP01_04010 [Actinomycetales bacterium]|nr:hypothetical protein [Actinomycetales bacterium]